MKYRVVSMVGESINTQLFWPQIEGIEHFVQVGNGASDSLLFFRLHKLVSILSVCTFDGTQIVLLICQRRMMDMEINFANIVKIAMWNAISRASFLVLPQDYMHVKSLF